MRVSPGPTADSTSLHGTTLPFEVRLDGIAAAELRQILAGRSIAAGWAGRVRRLTVAAVAPETSSAAETYRHVFVDGTAILRSGCRARVEVGDDSQAPEYLLPQSLNLALAQQWARLGLMALHAAALRVGNRHVLVLGPKASGKSTLCLATLATGGQVLSDDWLLLGQDSHARVVCERLRRFLMVRDCWASDQLQVLRPDLAFRRSGARPKQVLPVETEGAHFLPSLAIDEIWVMERTRGARGAYSRKSPENATHVLAHLIKAAMPLLFSARFALEHRAQMRTAQALLQACPAYRVQTGTDLVEQPVATLERLAAG